MKNKSAVTVIAILIAQSVFGQWTQLTTPTGNWYEGIHFVNANVGWAVGWDGVIIKTTDGGQTWVSQTSGTGENLKEVYFIDQNNGWVVGDWNNIGNTLLKTTNGGNTWQLLDPDPPTKRYYEDIQFVGSTHGWIVGASCKLLHTSDGGQTWANQSVGTTTPHLLSVFFINSTTGWVSSSDGRIWKTTNSGTTWVLQSTPTALLEDALYDVFFVDANKGWACGYKGVVLATNNGGTTWTQIATNAAGNNNHILTIHFTSATTGFANGAWGQVIKTTDGGYTWTQASANMGFGEKIFFTNSNIGWCAGSNGIAKTTNGGNPVTSGISENESAEIFVVYPNPCTDRLNITLMNNAEAKYFIIDFQGKVVSAGKLEHEASVCLNDLPSNNYTIIIEQKGKRGFHRFVKID